MTTKEIRTDSLRAWLLAARPKTLTGAAVPVMLGCGLAAADGGFVLLPAVLCLAFALLMQIDANLINDLRLRTKQRTLHVSALIYLLSLAHLRPRLGGR